ncbi:MAG: glycosyltransferase family 39 protein [Planctomycetaceae bacterium]|nr:glycosyltransferase family 39 protein [Planctomycetaceae bacterium]
MGKLSPVIQPGRSFDKLMLPLILTLHVVLVGISAWQHSPTLDEPAYLTAGLRHLHSGRFDSYKVTPPLVRSIAALPVNFLTNFDDLEFEGSIRLRPEFDAGHRFLTEHGQRSFWLVTIARWACIPFSLLGALCLHNWGRDLYGHAAGRAALVLWCFSPNIFAHAQLLTPDIAVTSLCIAFMYFSWKWRHAPTWKSAFALGGILGIAVLSKTSAILLLPVAFLAELRKSRETGCHMSTGAIRYLVTLMMMINIVNLGYLFEFSPCSLSEVAPRSTTLNNLLSINATIGKLPLPLPLSFVEGINLQLMDFENRDGGIQTFIAGTWTSRSRWWYYLYAAALKIPLGILFLFLIGLGSLVGPNRQLPIAESAVFVLAPLFFAFLIPSLASGFGSGIRYVLPGFPFLFLVASSAFCTKKNWYRIVVRNVLLAWAVLSSVLNYPHSLSYFNELAGGPENGHNCLLEGGVDYGQDLLFALNWKEKNGHKSPVYFSYWGPVQAGDLNPAFLTLPRSPAALPEHGWCLISVNYLHDSRCNEDFSTRSIFAESQPTCHLTPAIHIYEFERIEGTIRVVRRR